MPILIQRPCPKCRHNIAEAGEFRAAGGFWSALFNFSTCRFSYYACQRCGYTEFYRGTLSSTSKVIDFLGS